MTTERIYVLPVEQTDWIVGEGQAPTMERHASHRLEEGLRSGESDGVSGRSAPHLWHLHLEQDDSPGEGGSTAPRPSFSALAVPARRAGGSHLRRQAGADGADDRFQVLCGNAGH